MDMQLPIEAAHACGVAVFVAEVGDERLTLTLSGTARHAPGAALLLADADEVLQAVDRWIGTALAWRWDARASDETLPVSADAGVAHDVRPLLDPSPDLMARLPAVPAALVESVRWPAREHYAVLTRFALDDSERDAIEVGGAVLIAESMATGWTGWLVTAGDTPACLPIALAAPDRVSRIAMDESGTAHAPGEGSRPAVAGEGAVFEVRAGFVGPVPLRCLGRGFDGALPPLARAASLWSAGPGGRWIAGGELLPWGGGWMLRITDLGERF